MSQRAPWDNMKTSDGRVHERFDGKGVLHRWTRCEMAHGTAIYLEEELHPTREIATCLWCVGSRRDET